MIYNKEKYIYLKKSYMLNHEKKKLLHQCLLFAKIRRFSLLRIPLIIVVQ